MKKTFNSKVSSIISKFLTVIFFMTLNLDFSYAQSQSDYREMYEKRKQELKTAERKEKEGRKEAKASFSKSEYDKALAQKEKENKEKDEWEWKDRKYYPYNTKKVAHGIYWGWTMGRDVVAKTKDYTHEILSIFSPSIGYLVDFYTARHFYIESGVVAQYSFETFEDEPTIRALELRLPILFNAKARHFKFVFGVKFDYIAMFDGWYKYSEQGYWLYDNGYKTYDRDALAYGKGGPGRHWVTPEVTVELGTSDVERKFNVSPVLGFGWDIKRFSFGFSTETPILDNSYWFPAICWDFTIKF